MRPLIFPDIVFHSFLFILFCFFHFICSFGLDHHRFSVLIAQRVVLAVYDFLFLLFFLIYIRQTSNWIHIRKKLSYGWIASLGVRKVVI
jgi:hypothetical protein